MEDSGISMIHVTIIECPVYWEHHPWVLDWQPPQNDPEYNEANSSSDKESLSEYLFSWGIVCYGIMVPTCMCLILHHHLVYVADSENGDHHTSETDATEGNNKRLCWLQSFHRLEQPTIGLCMHCVYSTISAWLSNLSQTILQTQHQSSIIFDYWNWTMVKESKS